MQTLQLAVLGGTGMIGRELIALLSDDPSVEFVRMLVRRPITSPHPKVEVKLVDFEDAESIKLAIDGCEAVFCAIGTTQKKVKGDQEAYKKIDFDIPVRAARVCHEIGCRKFLLVSAVGANSKSSNFYLRLKGHVEDAISLEPFASIHFFQPSLLLGNRDEKRFGEKMAMKVLPLLAPLMIGSLSKYRPIQARQVAMAMIRAAKSPALGVPRYRFRDMVENRET
jgi:uncharacterized protein YbjT (DUF2867 family)